ncbi:uncharacterized protein LOC111086215 [Limulus polyphemus]|uniref:Uncharacterized protein LOC111086215 n=1 Tax=Limulus polyphemus TaxID=6850 RepID=A0ABM1SJR6_LIMPO|nr:uncharacterized protein LOC111086215 [Limulus polyphemus]
MGNIDLMIPEIMPNNIRRRIGIIDRSHSQHSRARRALFGPVDHEENLRFVHEELNKIQDKDEERWNFNFKTETSLPWGYLPTLAKDRKKGLQRSYKTKSLQKCKTCAKICCSSLLDIGLQDEPTLKFKRTVVTACSTKILTTDPEKSYNPTLQHQKKITEKRPDHTTTKEERVIHLTIFNTG